MARLDHAQAAGKLDEMNQQFAAKVKDHASGSRSGNGACRRDAVWEFDPAIVVENDIRDHKGNPMGAWSAGQSARDWGYQKLIFVDGDDPAEVEWALGHGSDERAKDVRPRNHENSPASVLLRPGGQALQCFGITRTPALVEAKGDLC